MFQATFYPLSGALFKLKSPFPPGNTSTSTSTLETGGCDCSLKRAPDDGQNVARNILSSVYVTEQ
jgi:hypothetical protein